MKEGNSFPAGAIGDGGDRGGVYRRVLIAGYQENRASMNARPWSLPHPR